MRTWLKKLRQQAGRIFEASASPKKPTWHQPGTYSVWAYDIPECNEPMLVAVEAWTAGGLRGVRLRGVWLHEDDTAQENDRDFQQIRGDWDNQDTLAGLIASGRLHRIGLMPPIRAIRE
jgi:hypothetical protein